MVTDEERRKILAKRIVDSDGNKSLFKGMGMQNLWKIVLEFLEIAKLWCSRRFLIYSLKYIRLHIFLEIFRFTKGWKMQPFVSCIDSSLVEHQVQASFELKAYW